MLKNYPKIYLLILVVTKKHGAIWLFKGSFLQLIEELGKVNCTIWEKFDKDQHHFLPKKNKLEKDAPWINNVGNIFLITSQENREEIKNKLPSEYLLEGNPTDEALNSISKAHLVSFELLKNAITNNNIEMYHDLILDRKELLIDKIKNKWTINIL